MAPTASVELEFVPSGIDRDRDGSDGGDRLLQSALVSLTQELVLGAVGGAERWSVAAQTRLKEKQTGLEPVTGVHLL